MSPPREPWSKITVTMGDYDISISDDAEVSVADTYDEIPYGIIYMV